MPEENQNNQQQAGTQGGTQGGDGTGGGGFQAITSQEELNRVIGARINQVKSQYADYDVIREKAAKFDQADEANKSELQKALDRAEKAEKDLTPAQTQVARLEVALEKGLTLTQAKRLVGTTKDELAADADELLADLGGKSGGGAGGKRPDARQLQSGSRGNGDENAGLTGKERAAALLRQYRSASH